MVTQDRTLFEEEIVAFQHGPVVFEVFCEHVRKKSIVSSDVSGDVDRMGPEDRAVVDAVLYGYGSLTVSELEALSRSESPWASAFDHGSNASSPVVSAGSMLDYYSRIMESDGGTGAAHHVPIFTFAPRVYVCERNFNG